MILLFNNFALAYQILHNSVSSNHPDLEQWMLTRFLEEVITLMFQTLSQTGIKRKYNVLGKLNHICFTGSFFLLVGASALGIAGKADASLSHHSHGNAPGSWHALLRQGDGCKISSTLQFCYSGNKQI